MVRDLGRLRKESKPFGVFDQWSAAVWGSHVVGYLSLHLIVHVSGGKILVAPHHSSAWMRNWLLILLYVDWQWRTSYQTEASRCDFKHIFGQLDSKIISERASSTYSCIYRVERHSTICVLRQSINLKSTSFGDSMPQSQLWQSADGRGCDSAGNPPPPGAVIDGARLSTCRCPNKYTTWKLPLVWWCCNYVTWCDWISMTSPDVPWVPKRSGFDFNGLSEETRKCKCKW